MTLLTLYPYLPPPVFAVPGCPECRTARARFVPATPLRRRGDEPRVCLRKAWATGARDGAFFSTYQSPSTEHQP